MIDWKVDQPKLKTCWNCGRAVEYSVCDCGIDLWMYPFRVPVQPHPIFADRWVIAP